MSENYDQKYYNDYLRDVAIAQNAISDVFLFPTGNIKFDLYAIPSHNHQAYYAIIYEKGGFYEMVYARTEIYKLGYPEPIRMYPFIDALDAKKHADSNGRIIVGLKRPNTEFRAILEDLAYCLPSGRFIGDSLICIDGVFQAIRIYDYETIIKEAIYGYGDIKQIPIPADKSYLRNELENMYLTIERIIFCE